MQTETAELKGVTKAQMDQRIRPSGSVKQTHLESRLWAASQERRKPLYNCTDTDPCTPGGGAI